MKIDRYKICPCRCDTFAEIVIDPDGSVCYTRDVAKLEASHAELLETATNVVEWWDSDSGVSPSAYGLIDQLRAAIAKAKGEQP